MVTLWHASGTQVPAELLAALSGARPDAAVRIKVVCDPFMALAALCKVRLQERARTESATSARLVMVYPELLTDAPDLCAAADTYAPGVPRWQYGPATNPTLRPIVDEDVARWSSKGSSGSTPTIVVVPEAVHAAVVARNTRPIPAAGPQLRLAGEGPVGGLHPEPLSTPQALDNHGKPTDAQRLAGDTPSPSNSRSAPLITDEELRMLLGEHSDEGHTGP